jgi:hypothetical protein
MFDCCRFQMSDWGFFDSLYSNVNFVGFSIVDKHSRSLKFLTAMDRHNM